MAPSFIRQIKVLSVPLFGIFQRCNWNTGVLQWIRFRVWILTQPELIRHNSIDWMMWFIQFISFKNKIIKLITELLKYACKITNQTARHDSSD